MTFLKISPYLKVGNTLSEDIVTTGGTYKAGTKVTETMVKKAKGTVITLKVIDNPSVTREFNRNKTKTFNTNGKSAFVYYNSGDANTSFKVKVLVSKKDILSDNKTVFYYLDYYYSHCFDVSVVADTEVIPNGVYTISDFTQYDVIRKDYYECEIEFSKYQKVKGKLTNKCTILQSYLKTCKKPSDKVYTYKQIKAKKSKAKPTTCIGYVNKVLYQLGYWQGTKALFKHYVPTSKAGKKKYKAKSKSEKANALNKRAYNDLKNYWTPYSKSALKKFQKKWNKKKLKPTIKENGRLTNGTWEAIKRYPELKKK